MLFGDSAKAQPDSYLHKKLIGNDEIKQQNYLIWQDQIINVKNNAVQLL